MSQLARKRHGRAALRHWVERMDRLLGNVTLIADDAIKLLAAKNTAEQRHGE